MKTIIFSAALMLSGCASMHSNQTLVGGSKTIIGASCKNWLVQPAPSLDAALYQLKIAANGRSHSEPVCKTSDKAGIGSACGMYWSQIVCEANLND